MGKVERTQGLDLNNRYCRDLFLYEKAYQVVNYFINTPYKPQPDKC